MKRENLLIKLLLLSFILFLGLMSNSYSAIKAISCETNFGERSFTIEGSNIAFHNEKKDGRSISSILETKTQVSFKGFKKTVYKDGYKHLINIKNLNQFDSDNDFLAVTSPKGHKMTYPLNCSHRE